MMRHLKPVLLPALAIPLLLAGNHATRAQATTPQFLFQPTGTTPTSYTQNLSSLSVGVGQTFTFSVWYQYQPTSSLTAFGLDVFVGYDQTTSSGESATPANGYLTLAPGATLEPDSGSTAVVTNVNSRLSNVSNGLGGGQDPSDSPTPSSATRPYGIDVSLFDTGGFSFATGSTPVHLFDITLTNTNLGPGGSQNVVIYSNDPASQANDFTSYVLASNGAGGFSRISPASSTIMTVMQSTDSAMPEPSSIGLLFVSGGVSLAYVRQRRRRQRTG